METLTAIPNQQISNYVPDHHDLVVSPAEEKAIARELTPSVAWPTLVLAMALPSILAALVYLGFSRLLPLWLCTPILALVSYSHYTLVHESVHGNLVPGYPRLRWLNEIVGWVGSLGMGLAWPFLKRTHVKHHSHTNTELDPDIFVKGTLAQLLVKWTIMSMMSFIPLPLLKHVNRDRYERVSRLLIGTESWQMAPVTCLTPALLVAAFVTGHFAEWFFLWFLPIRFAAASQCLFPMVAAPSVRSHRALSEHAYQPLGWRNDLHAPTEPPFDAPSLAERSILQISPPVPPAASRPAREGIEDRRSDDWISRSGQTAAGPGVKCRRHACRRESPALTPPDTSSRAATDRCPSPRYARSACRRAPRPGSGRGWAGCNCLTRRGR